MIDTQHPCTKNFDSLDQLRQSMQQAGIESGVMYLRFQTDGTLEGTYVTNISDSILTMSVLSNVPEGGGYPVTVDVAVALQEVNR